MKNEKNLLLKPENISLKDDIRTCHVICLFLDIRKSTQINEKYDSKELYKIYAKILNESYNKLINNGFKNVEIQDDGIYGLFPFVNQEIGKISTVAKCINDISDIMENIHKNYCIKTTISIRFGKEWYSAFGEEKNKKVLSFFGNVVSKTKKMNSLAINNKIVISKSKFNNDVYNELIDKLKNKGKELYLRNGKSIGSVYLVKWK